MSNPKQSPVKPLVPLAPWVGGKRNLARRIIARIEKIPHDLYAEPFVGMAGVFLRRRRRPKAEMINDLNRDVATLFRILQRHYVPFMDTLKWQLTSRSEFERLVATDPDTLTDLERAARFLYLQRTAFGGKVTGQTFGVSADRPARFDITRLAPLLEDVHERLAGVVIECLPYDRFIERYDRAGALFYLDPPYMGSETDYGRELFGPEDFERLGAVLNGLKGAFILSINDRPEVREIFGWASLEPVRTIYTVSDKTPAEARELLVSTPARRVNA